MRIPRKVGRFRAVIAAVVLAIGALAIPSSTVPASTQPAIARDAQPAAARDAQPAIAEAGCTPVASEFDWETLFSGRGVTLCRGYDFGGLNDVAFVQIVDLNAGAKIRLVSETCHISECDHIDQIWHVDGEWYKRTAEEWFDWTQSNVDPPNPASELFSTSNASYFTDTDGPTTKLSLPMHHFVEHIPPADWVAHTWGWAYDTCPDNNDTIPACHADLAWDRPKRAISFADATAPKQKVETFDFPRHYSHEDVLSLHGYVPDDEARQDGDGTVGFTPDSGGTGSDRRTFVGVDDGGISGNVDTVYILNTDDDFTVGEAETILESFGSVFEVQLDGGGSTQLYANGDYLIDSDLPFDRQVPDTLAVYLAP